MTMEINLNPGKSSTEEPSLTDLILKPKSTTRITRPPNAFMLFARDHRRKLAQVHRDLSNKAISAILGKMWKSSKEEVRVKYFQRSQYLSDLHKKQYPGYVYSPQEARRRKLSKIQEKVRRRHAASQLSDGKQVYVEERQDNNPVDEHDRKDVVRNVPTTERDHSSPGYVPNNLNFFLKKEQSSEQYSCADTVVESFLKHPTPPHTCCKNNSSMDVSKCSPGLGLYHGVNDRNIENYPDGFPQRNMQNPTTDFSPPFSDNMLHKNEYIHSMYRPSAENCYTGFYQEMRNFEPFPAGYQHPGQKPVDSKWSDCFSGTRTSCRSSPNDPFQPLPTHVPNMPERIQSKSPYLNQSPYHRCSPNQYHVQPLCRSFSPYASMPPQYMFWRAPFEQYPMTHFMPHRPFMTNNFCGTENMPRFSSGIFSNPNECQVSNIPQMSELPTSESPGEFLECNNTESVVTHGKLSPREMSLKNNFSACSSHSEYRNCPNVTARNDVEENDERCEDEEDDSEYLEVEL